MNNVPHWFRHILLNVPARELFGRTRRSLRKLLKFLLIDFSTLHGFQPRVIADDLFDTRNLCEDARARVNDNVRAMDGYRGRPYPGRAVLFRARARPLFRSHSTDLGWRALALGGLKIVDIPGSHGTMLLEPHVHMLAREFRAALDAVDDVGQTFD